MKTDIVIVGAGVIGMSLALSLSQRNKKNFLKFKQIFEKYPKLFYFY